MKNDTEINIDVLLRDTWLTVVELRQGTPVRRGLALYHHCQQQVEQVRQTLLNAGFSQQDTEHITYAQCALLDETVLSREDPDDGQKVWLETPLQAHFFNTLQQRELWHLTRMDIVAGQLRNVALRLERHTPQGMEINVTPINALTTTSIAPENVVQLAIQPERQAAATAPRRSWPMFFAGMMTAACLSGIGIGGWIFFNQPDLREQERNALPVSELSHYAQAQKQLLRLSQQLDTLDERKGKYMTASELKSAVFAIRQSLQTPPLEELLRQLDEQTRAGEVAPALIVQIETRFQQLLNRYALLSNPRVNHSEQEKTP